MTPTNWFSFFFIVYFLAPGIFYEVRRKRHQPKLGETQIQEIGRVFVASTLISTLSVGFISCEYWIYSKVQFGEAKFPNFNSINLTENLGTSFYFLSIFAANAFVIVYVYDLFTIARHLPQTTGVPLWDVLFNNLQARPLINLNTFPVKVARSILVKTSPALRRLNFGDHRNADLITIPITRIELTDGEVVFGMVDLYTNEYSLADREIVLSPMKREWIMFLTPGWQKLAKPVVEWKRKSVNINSIKSIEVVHFNFPRE